MSDCSGIKTYLRPNEFEISKYIDLSEKSEEERILEFVRTIELAIDSLDREKYSLDIFADIVGVACNNVSDIFVENSKNVEDCVITSPYIIIDKTEVYSEFADGIRLCLKKYKEDLIDINTFYKHLNRDYEILKNTLNLGHKSKVKTNMK